MSTCWNLFEGRLVLASRSPRRRRILEMAGIPFIQAPSDMDETGFTGSPEEVVLHWARMKADSVSELRPDHPVLGADTLVALDSRLLGKPLDGAEAFEMLASLAGRWHTVHGGVSVKWRERFLDISFTEATRVRFRDLTSGEIQSYIDTGEPMDKAGAYGIQGYGCALVDRIEGCYFNVMGLPISRLVRECAQFPGNGG